jgi:hypothetical protein
MTLLVACSSDPDPTSDPNAKGYCSELSTLAASIESAKPSTDVEGASASVTDGWSNMMEVGLEAAQEGFLIDVIAIGDAETAQFDASLSGDAAAFEAALDQYSKAIQVEQSDAGCP